jgi:hypothetical protein
VFYNSFLLKLEVIQSLKFVSVKFFFDPQIVEEIETCVIKFVSLVDGLISKPTHTLTLKEEMAFSRQLKKLITFGTANSASISCYVSTGHSLRQDGLLCS